MLKTFNDLHDILADYYRHPYRMIFLAGLPFRLGYFIGPFFFDSMSREKIATKKRDIYIDKMIAQARERIKIGDEKTDLATILVKMCHEDGGEVLSNQQLRSQLYTFMVTGFDTSASAIHWILFFVGQYPEMAKRIGRVLLTRVLSHNF